MFIDILEKTPDALVGTAVAGLVWFGFNHAVLAERAMDEVISKEVVPACMAELQRAENAHPINNVPQFRIPGYEDDPLAIIVSGLIKTATSGYRLTHAERHARCLCGVQNFKSQKFDYAVHTASFRLIDAESVSGMRSKSMKLVQSQACGSLPWLNVGG